MNTYIIRLISPLNLFLTITIPLLLVVIFVFNSIAFIPLLLAVILLAATVFMCLFWLPKYTAKAQVEILIQDEGISIHWLKQFLLHKKSDIFIEWKDIQEFSCRQKQTFSVFKVALHNGNKVILRYDNEGGDIENFQWFLSEFQKNVDTFNNVAEPFKQIWKAKTIYETQRGFIIAILLTILLISVPILVVLFPPNKSFDDKMFMSISMIATGYVSGIFFIRQVVKHRRSLKQNSYS